MNAVTKRGIAGVISATPRTRWMALSSGDSFAWRDWPGFFWRSVSPVIATFKIRMMAIAAPDDHAIPVLIRAIIRRRQAGLFFDLARNAAGDIDDSIPEVIEIGRSGRKIDSSGVRSVRGHLAEHECAVGAAQRAHAKPIEDAVVGKAPVAPRQKACKIGLEIIGAKTFPGENRIAPQQNLAVPEFWLLGLLLRKMRVDLGAPFVRRTAMSTASISDRAA